MRIWYMEEDDTDQRLQHHKKNPLFLTIEELYKLTGVEYFHVSIPIFDISV